MSRCKRALLLLLSALATLRLYAALPGEQQYRVTLTEPAALDGEIAAKRLAATYRGRLESGVEAGGVFTITVSGAEAELLRKDGAVRTIQPLTSGAFQNTPAATGAASPYQIGPYAYDEAGNITGIGTDSFVYDTQNRLASGGADGQIQSYTYDAFGNILTITTSGSNVPSELGVDPETNRMDKAFADNGQPYNMFAGYDPDTGNVTSYLGDQFVYDALNVVTKSQAGGVWRAYIYTASDERIGTIELDSAGTSAVSSEWTFRDPNNQVLRRLSRDTAGNWQWIQDYIYRDGQMLASEVAAPVRRYQYHLDHLGTPRLITGNGGVEISRHTYYPFGREATTNGIDGEGKQFTGHERDATGLDYMHARYYNPFMGRFLSVDPAGSNPYKPQTWNRYAYTLNNPLRYTDPRGLHPCPIVGSDGKYHPGECIDVIAPYDRDLAEWNVMNRELDRLAEVRHRQQLERQAQQGDEFAMLALGRPVPGIEPTGAEFIVVAPLAGLLRRIGMAGGEIGLQAATEGSFFDGATFKLDPSLRVQLDPFHNFPESVMAFEEAGTVSAFTGADGMGYQMLSIPGGYMGKEGFFEFIKNHMNEITHYFFRGTP